MLQRFPRMSRLPTGGFIRISHKPREITSSSMPLPMLTLVMFRLRLCLVWRRNVVPIIRLRSRNDGMITCRFGLINENENRAM